MKEISFTFGGKSYKGSLATSTEEYPHYYWCFIDDPQLAGKIGDCITFQRDQGGVLQLSEIYPAKYRELLNALKTAVEQSMTATATA